MDPPEGPRPPVEPPPVKENPLVLGAEGSETEHPRVSITVTPHGLKSPAYRLFVQPLVQVNTEWNIMSIGRDHGTELIC